MGVQRNATRGIVFQSCAPHCDRDMTDRSFSSCPLLFTLCDRAGGSSFLRHRGIRLEQEMFRCWRKCPPRSSVRIADAVSQIWSGWLRRARRRRRSAATTWATKQVRISQYSTLRTAAARCNGKRNQLILTNIRILSRFRIRKSHTLFHFNDDGKISKNSSRYRRYRSRKKKKKKASSRLEFHNTWRYRSTIIGWGVPNNSNRRVTDSRVELSARSPFQMTFFFFFFFFFDFFWLVTHRKNQKR